MRPLVVSGFMATGKSTVARLVAGMLGVPFVDTDALLAEAAGKSTGELFASEGEARFREREAALVTAMLEDPTPRVIAFGGGTVTVPRVRHAALEKATLVTLTASPETVLARLPSLATRPNLAAAAPIERARDLLALRAEAYGECHATVATDGKTESQVAQEVAAVAEREALAMPLGRRTYAIDVVDGDPGRLSWVLERLAPSAVVVVTDANVAAARGAWLDAALSSLRVKSRSIVLTPGEKEKNLASVARIWDEALAFGVDRDAIVLAFGGGVVGDLTGFAASTTMRGVRYVQIATSLMAMVDSSVGGKTGFDLAAGKNLVGSFFQPSRVVIDLEHLETLDPRERRAGLAEIVKIALVREPALLEAVEGSAEALRDGNRAALAPVVRAAVQAKIRVVREDEQEHGVRALLNLGHTVGHALEAHGAYTQFLHGEAVAIGTVLELAACEALGLSPHGIAARADALFRRLGLATSVPRATIEDAFLFVAKDKKRTATAIRLPIVTGAGQAHVVRVEIDALKGALLR